MTVVGGLGKPIVGGPSMSLQVLVDLGKSYCFAQGLDWLNETVKVSNWLKHMVSSTDYRLVEPDEPIRKALQYPCSP